MHPKIVKNMVAVKGFDSGIEGKTRKLLQKDGAIKVLRYTRKP
jgi:hypothetical protein